MVSKSIVFWLCLGSVAGWISPMAARADALRKAAKQQNGDDLKTAAERSDYREATTSAAVIRFLDKAAERGKHIRRITFGKTYKQKPLVAAVIASPPVSKPEDLRNDDRLVVLVIGNIHSGECCGQEALLRMIRELLLRPNHPWLEKMVLILAPNYNSDGNDVRSIDNRPGQVGPANGMGQRANAQGFDLNRDYVKLESPEARALVNLMNRWDPACFIDCHTTNGSWHRYELTYDAQHNPASDAKIRGFLRERMFPTITRELLKQKVDTFYYGNFDKAMTRWNTYGHEPRYGTDYYGLRGRFSILSEAYAYVTFRERVLGTHAFVSECLDFLNGNANTVRTLIREADRRVIEAGKNLKANDRVPIGAKIAKLQGKYTVKGYDPSWQPRLKRQDLVPGVRPQPPGKPKDYPVDLYADFVPTKTVQRPYAYLIPERLRKVIDKLKQHGIRVEQLRQPRKLKVEVYEIREFQQARRAYQKHKMARALARSRTITATYPPGTAVVRTAQPLGNLLIYLLEPESDDGLLTWNYFDAEAKVGSDFPVVRVMRKFEIRAGNRDSQ